MTSIRRFWNVLHGSGVDLGRRDGHIEQSWRGKEKWASAVSSLVESQWHSHQSHTNILWLLHFHIISFFSLSSSVIFCLRTCCRSQKLDRKLYGGCMSFLSFLPDGSVLVLLSQSLVKRSGRCVKRPLLLRYFLDKHYDHFYKERRPCKHSWASSCLQEFLCIHIWCFSTKTLPKRYSKWKRLAEVQAATSSRSKVTASFCYWKSELTGITLKRFFFILFLFFNLYSFICWQRRDFSLRATTSFFYSFFCQF